MCYDKMCSWNDISNLKVWPCSNKELVYFSGGGAGGTVGNGALRGENNYALELKLRSALEELTELHRKKGEV